MKYTIGILAMLIALSICGVRCSKGITLKQNVTGYLKRAADASTIELANTELSKAISYLEANEMTSGNTSVLWERPKNDLDFWYRNLKASQNELQQLKSNSALEKTNVLIKLRETLLDTGEKSKVTVPDSLDVYPKHRFWALMMFLAAILGVVGLGLFVDELDKREKAKKARKN